MGIHTTIHRPQLTAAERAKRMEEIKLAAVQLVVATERQKDRKRNIQQARSS